MIWFINLIVAESCRFPTADNCGLCQVYLYSDANIRIHQIIVRECREARVIYCQYSVSSCTDCAQNGVPEIDIGCQSTAVDGATRTWQQNYVQRSIVY